ncbi:MAG: BMP family ABC transporter substrate-binding protein [Proteobacteria bacterium]|nr:BMP family ABC transporter substrate-binding protein [Pseudomonadota bacterium]
MSDFNFTRRTFLATSSAAALTMGAPLAIAAGPTKVGFVYVGPVGDHGWTHGHDLGRKAVEKKFGDKVKTTFVENVAEGPDSERVIRQLASSGHQLIFTTSFGFMNPTLKVAKQFPKVHFEHATGYKTAPNVSVYNARFHQGRAVIGTIAGHMSKSGVAGYIASFPIPEVVMGINAFTLAAQKVNPDFKTKVVWVNSWYDPGKESDATKTLIDQGADMITQHTDSPAPLQVAENRGVFGFGQASDMKAYAPRAQLTAILDDWSDYYIQRTQDVMDGAWKSQNIWQGMKEGMVKIAPYGDAITDAARDAAEKVRMGITDGSMHTFAGPIKNQAGEEVLPAGQSLTDDKMASMDWYVKGVQS